MKLDIFDNFLEKVKKEERYRNFLYLEKDKNMWPSATYNKEQIDVWCSTDYLAMSVHPVVLQAARETIDLCGIGSGGTRNIAGSYIYLEKLEKSLANLHKKEASIVFSSGYLSNFAAISSIGRISKGEMIIFSDSLNHSSIIEGIRSSKCRKIIFRHNDTKHLRELISEFPYETQKLIIFESIYSMDGSIGKIEEFCDIAKEFNAMTYIDEVHAVGLYGECGAGICEKLKISDHIDIIQGSLSKGFGVIGGYITGKTNVIDAIRSESSGFIFTSSLPTPITAACFASVEHLKTSHLERNTYFENLSYTLELFAKNNIELISHKSHIMSILIGEAKKAQQISEYLIKEHKIYVQHINYPTVPIGRERLRITTNAKHTKYSTLKFVELLTETLKIFEILKIKEFA